MNDKQIAEGKLGEIGEYDLDFKDGKLVGKVGVNFSDPTSILQVSGDLNVAISGASLIRAIEKKIGGPIPEVVGEFLINSVGLK
jgi:hypothetical protein